MSRWDPFVGLEGNSGEIVSQNLEQALEETTTGEIESLFHTAPRDYEGLRFDNMLFETL